MPKRIQRKRLSGWRKPVGAVYVGRGSRWGNPFVVGVDGTAQECVAKFSEMMFPYTHHGHRNTMTDFFVSVAEIEDIQMSLKGKDLMCWCPLDQPCHADVLLEIANL